MSGELSRGPARWKYSTGEDAGYLQLDEKTPEALLQLDIEYVDTLRSIDGRGWDFGFGWNGLVSEIPFCVLAYSNHSGKNAARQYLAGSFTGAVSSQRVTEEFKGQLGANGNRADSVMAQAGSTVRGTSRAGGKPEHSDPMIRIRRGQSSTDKSYSGDNRLVPPKRP